MGLVSWARFHPQTSVTSQRQWQMILQAPIFANLQVGTIYLG